MADVKGPTIASNKLAMSRALGAAFLSHQVQQLENSVSNGGPGGPNWRDRTSEGYNRNHNDSRRPRGTPKFVKRRDGDATEVDREDRLRRREFSGQKDADVVIVDASVLVHALGQVKKWCKEGREEIIIVPLEALNTLDLLKKGMSSLAQRARAASRILEAQVGTNPRIRVQRDDAFVLWDSIFQTQPPPTGCPEWVRRVICCARWEMEHAEENGTDFKTSTGPDGLKKPRVVLAVLSQAPEIQSEAVFPPMANPSASPVPLPAPQTNRHEPRSSGALVCQWAVKASIEVLEVRLSTPNIGGSPPSVNAPLAKEAPANGRRSPQATRRSGEEERGKREARRSSYLRNGNERSEPTCARPGYNSGLVERPPAVMAMMEMVAQPSKVVRVLARGEKLDPDT